MDLAAAIAACRTEADHYQVRIAAENRLTPCEVEALAEGAAMLPAPAREWVLRLQGLVRRIGAVPEPYRRRAIAEEVEFYAGQGPEGAARDLVIAFAGVGMRVMMPTAAVLQALPAARCDVVLLADSSRCAFIGGVPGYAEGPEGLVARLGADLPLGRYAAIRTFGVSAGGAAALCCGRLLGAAVAVSAAGAHPLGLALRQARPGIDRWRFDRAMAAAPPGRTRLICVHGAAHLRDAVRSRLQGIGLPGSRNVALAGIAHHGVIAGLYLVDALTRFFAEFLLSDAPPEGDLWQP